MKRSFFADVVAAVALLPDAKEYRELERCEDSQCFGNTYVVFEASHIKLRFVKDRDEVRTDIAPPNRAEWWTLSQLCEVFGRPAPGFDLQSNIEALLLNYSEIVGACQSASVLRTAAAIDTLAREKQDKFLERFGKK